MDGFQLLVSVTALHVCVCAPSYRDGLVCACVHHHIEMASCVCVCVCVCVHHHIEMAVKLGLFLVVSLFSSVGCVHGKGIGGHVIRPVSNNQLV